LQNLQRESLDFQKQTNFERKYIQFALTLYYLCYVKIMKSLISGESNQRQDKNILISYILKNTIFYNQASNDVSTILIYLLQP